MKRLQHSRLDIVLIQGVAMLRSAEKCLVVSVCLANLDQSITQVVVVILNNTTPGEGRYYVGRQAVLHNS